MLTTATNKLLPTSSFLNTYGTFLKTLMFLDKALPTSLTRKFSSSSHSSTDQPSMLCHTSGVHWQPHRTCIWEGPRLALSVLCLIQESKGNLLIDCFHFHPPDIPWISCSRDQTPLSETNLEF